MGADFFIESIYQVNHDRVKGDWEKAIQIRNNLFNKLRDEGVEMGRAIEADVTKRASEPDLDESPKVRRLRDQATAAQARGEELYSTLCGGEGYFRDGYNPGSFFWQLFNRSRKLPNNAEMQVGPAMIASFAIMRAVSDALMEYVEDVDNQPRITPANAQKLVDFVESQELWLPSADELRAAGCKVSDDVYGETSLSSYHEYYNGRREQFLAFLRLAIKLDEPIACSF
jgi:hypothetical protein